MRWPVGVLALLATVGGFLQFAPLWHPLSTWLEPVAGPISDADLDAGVDHLGDRARRSALARHRGRVARSTSAKRRARAAAVRAPRAEVLLGRALRRALVPQRRPDRARLLRLVERPLIAGSLTALTGGAGLGSRELGRAQTGLVRSYALALAGGLAVLMSSS